MDQCQIHSKKQPILTNEVPTNLLQKYQNKKKAYKESFIKLSSDMNVLLQKQLQQEQELNQLRTQYSLEKEQWIKDKSILKTLIPNIDINNIQNEKKNYKEKNKLLKQQIHQLEQQQEYQGQQMQQILLENSKVKAILMGRDQECNALQQEIDYYQRRLIQLQKN